MRTATRTKGPRALHSTVQSVPAPIGGWNARDSLANMAPQDAVMLKNWFPTTIDCEIRGGNTDFATITGDAETLAVHVAETGTETFFAISDTDVYNITAGGAGVAATLTVTDGKYQWLNMGDGTSNWLMMFNGADKPKYYNGSAWTEVDAVSTPAITGATSTTLIQACQYHSRLFAIQKNTLSFWYTAAAAVAGAMTEFKLDSFAQRGGYLMWAQTWTMDAGDGLDDYIVFMTSEGEAIVYTGTNPGSANTWTRVGTYYIGPPIGRRSYLRFGGDLLVITRNGVFNMSQGLSGALVNEQTAITDKIKNAFNSSARSYSSSFGWEAIHYPDRNAVLFNIPESNTAQYVMNAITGAWCKFDSWDALTFCLYNNDLYFGGSGIVQKAWTGTSDDGSNIVAEAKTSFNNFGSLNKGKRLNLYRPMLQVSGNIEYLSDVEVDFDETTISGVASYSIGDASVWDTGTWDTAQWSSGKLTSIRKWSSPDCPMGYYFAGKLKIATNSTLVHWVVSDYVYEEGGIMS